MAALLLAMPTREASARTSTVTLRSNVARAVFMACGVGATLLLGYLAVTDTVGIVVFAALGPLVFVEGLRARIVVDPASRTISSTRAFRTWHGSFGDIENVRVPPWGPIILTLREGSSASSRGMWPGQVLTSVYADRTGSDGRAARLAGLIGVPLVSVWPQVRPGHAGPKQIGPDFVIWIGVAVCMAALVAIEIAMLAAG